MSEPMFLALHYRLLFQILQDSFPPFFTYSGSLPNFLSLLMPKNILYMPGKNLTDPDSLLKKGSDQWHIVLIEPLNNVVGVLRILRRHELKITLKNQLQM